MSLSRFSRTFIPIAVTIVTVRSLSLIEDYVDVRTPMPRRTVRGQVDQLQKLVHGGGRCLQHQSTVAWLKTRSARSGSSGGDRSSPGCLTDVMNDTRQRVCRRKARHPPGAQTPYTDRMRRRCGRVRCRDRSPIQWRCIVCWRRRSAIVIVIAAAFTPYVSRLKLFSRQLQLMYITAMDLDKLCRSVTVVTSIFSARRFWSYAYVTTVLFAFWKLQGPGEGRHTAAHTAYYRIRRHVSPYLALLWHFCDSGAIYIFTYLYDPLAKKVTEGPDSKTPGACADIQCFRTHRIYLHTRSEARVTHDPLSPLFWSLFF